MHQDQFKKVLQLCQAYETPVIVFADVSYLEVLKNWWNYFSAVATNKVIVVALNDGLESQIEGLPMACVTIAWSGSLEELWLLRAQLFSQISAAGVDFIHSDIDAIWKRNPVPFCQSFEADFVFSPGTVWPPDVVKEWGFVVCCGFFFVRATARASAFFQRVAHKLSEVSDDQVVVNRVLREDGMKWRFSSEPIEVCVQNGYPYKIFYDAILGDSRFCSVALLPARLFPRKPDHADDPMVAHYLSKKSGDDKKLELKRNGLWGSHPRG